MRVLVARVRFGTLALGLSALLLTAFPLVRPFFPLDPYSPGETLAIAGSSITSARWLVAHLLAMMAFVLLPFGMLALYAYLRVGVMETSAWRALAWSLAGIVLIMPMLGFETFVLPILGKLYLAGTPGIAPVLGLIYLGPAIGVFLLGLLFLAIGVIYLSLPSGRIVACRDGLVCCSRSGLPCGFRRFRARSASSMGSSSASAVYGWRPVCGERQKTHCVGLTDNGQSNSPEPSAR